MYIQAGIPIICIQRGVDFFDTTPEKTASHFVRYEGSSPEPHRRRGRRASPTKKNRPTTVCGRVSRISTISFSRILGPSTPPRLPLDSWRPKAPLARGRSGRFGSPRHPAGAKDGERAPSPNKTPRHLLVTGRVEPLRGTPQCANSVSAPQASGYHLQGAAREGEIGRERHKTRKIPRFGPGRHRPIGSPPLRAAGQGQRFLMLLFQTEFLD